MTKKYIYYRYYHYYKYIKCSTRKIYKKCMKNQMQQIIQYHKVIIYIILNNVFFFFQSSMIMFSFIQITYNGYKFSTKTLFRNCCASLGHSFATRQLTKSNTNQQNTNPREYFRIHLHTVSKRQVKYPQQFFMFTWIIIIIVGDQK